MAFAETTVFALFAVACIVEAREQRIKVKVHKHFSFGDQVFIRGGKKGSGDSIPIRHVGTSIGDAKVSSWRYGDDHLDWQGHEDGQSDHSGEQAAGTPLYWTDGDNWLAEFYITCPANVQSNFYVRTPPTYELEMKVYVRKADGSEYWYPMENKVFKYCEYVHRSRSYSFPWYARSSKSLEIDL